MGRLFRYAFYTEWLNIARSIEEALYAPLFFMIVATLFPLSQLIEKNELPNIAAGVLWVAVLLSLLLGIDRLFREDFKQGIIQEWLLVPESERLVGWIIAKLIVFWLIYIVPFILVFPLFMLMYQVDWNSMGRLVLSLLLGSPTIILLGATVNVLSLLSRQGSVLMMLLVLPFCIPIIIFASHSVLYYQFADTLTSNNALIWLTVMLLIAMASLPWIMTVLLRMMIRYQL